MVRQYARRRCFRDTGAAVLQTAAVNELRARKIYKRQKSVTNYACLCSTEKLTKIIKEKHYAIYGCAKSCNEYV